MSMPQGFDTAWRQALHEVRHEGSLANAPGELTSPGSGFGLSARRVRETLGATLAFSNARDRLIASPARGWSLAYAMAYTLWVLSGRNDLEFVRWYNARAPLFSDDGRTFNGAYGPRWLTGTVGHRPFDRLLRLLREDPDTRRAVLSAYEQNDLGALSRDVPCALGIQALLREGRLHAVVHMRSQSLAMVMPYDTFLFTVVQEMMAIDLGVEVGSHRVLAGSLHTYLDEDPLVEAVLAEPMSSVTVMPAMPSSPWPWLPRLMHHEQGIRTGALRPEDLAFLDLPDYWKTWLAVLGTVTWGLAPEALALIPPSWHHGLRAPRR